MAVTIRLRRTGARNLPLYRIVVADSRSPVKGRFIEKLGWYDPRAKKVEVDKDRVLHWVSKGARISNSVKKLLLNFAIVPSNELN
ncbi:30S ribosomal protein S16 [Candidatus Aerophobetes bacterium]|nr:30S ribosomal protein S16 [Candidatus Aerophobetes bacterium]